MVLISIIVAICEYAPLIAQTDGVFFVEWRMPAAYGLVIARSDMPSVVLSSYLRFTATFDQRWQCL